MKLGYITSEAGYRVLMLVGMLIEIFLIALLVVRR